LQGLASLVYIAIASNGINAERGILFQAKERYICSSIEDTLRVVPELYGLKFPSPSTQVYHPAFSTLWDIKSEVNIFRSAAIIIANDHPDHIDGGIRHFKFQPAEEVIRPCDKDGIMVSCKFRLGMAQESPGTHSTSTRLRDLLSLQRDSAQKENHAGN
jgi:hypothetical protein